jgi:hypothetical protein
VVGASGSGKSSLVRAGLLPALRAGAVLGSADWEVVVTTPTAPRPEQRGSRRRLLVVDQLEEVWTTLPLDAADRYLSDLAAWVEASDTTVLLVVRADYYAHLVDSPEVSPPGSRRPPCWSGG